jgi:hypothetical protein
VLTTRSTERGVIAGISVSLIVMIAVRLFTPLAWTWYVLLGALICVSAGWLASHD